MRPIVPDRRITPNGMILLNKPAGKTSFQALFPVKREYGPNVGHTGTLDQFAEGLLVVLLGKFTRFTPFFTEFDKVYEADFTFGQETSTLDPGGEVTFSGEVPTLEAIKAYADQFRGPLLQIPPQYSAVHVDGKRAYERVLAGETPELVPRNITVYHLEILAWAQPVLTVRVHCSKGTYIRSLARDWGRLAGCGAFVSRLVRHRVGPFALPTLPQVFRDDRQTLGDLGIPCLTVGDLGGILRGLDPMGQAPELAAVTATRAALYNPSGVLGAVVEKKGSRWGYLFVQPRGAE